MKKKTKLMILTTLAYLPFFVYGFLKGDWWFVFGIAVGETYIHLFHLIGHKKQVAEINMTKLTKTQWSVKYLYRCPECKELVEKGHFIPRYHCRVPIMTYV